jgi:protoporphyrinogen oxidase
VKIAIVGAGLTGLSCALSLKDYDVVVFEKGEVGGLLASHNTGKYFIEKFYHHCFRWDEELLRLIRKLGLSSKLVWKVVKIGFAIEGKIYPLNTPLEILRYPHLSLRDKIKLALFTLKSRKRDYRVEDEKGVVEGIREELGDNLLEKFFMPLLKAKFGEYYVDVSYAWLLARVAIRSNRKMRGEELGYLRHGFHQLVEKMAEGLNIKRKAVDSIGVVNGKFAIHGKEFDAVVWTAPLPYLDPKIKNYIELPEIRYQSSICALLSAEKPLSDLYWINVDNAVFGAIIEHTNFMPLEDYGEHLIYLASYSTPDGWLFNLSEKELANLYLKEIERFGLKRRDVKWIKVFKAKYSAPIYEKGYLKKIIPYRTKLNGFYIAGLVSPPNYPERSMNGSIKAGLEVAEVIKSDFGLS